MFTNSNVCVWFTRVEATLFSTCVHIMKCRHQVIKVTNFYINIHVHVYICALPSHTESCLHWAASSLPSGTHCKPCDKGRHRPGLDWSGFNVGNDTGDGRIMITHTFFYSLANMMYLNKIIPWGCDSSGDDKFECGDWIDLLLMLSEKSIFTDPGARIGISTSSEFVDWFRIPTFPEFGFIVESK